MNAASKWRPAWAVLAGYVPVSARLHLALFYFYGVYYHWAKRATGDPHSSTTCQTLYTLSTPTITSGGRQVQFNGRVQPMVWPINEVCLPPSRNQKALHALETTPDAN